MGDDGSTKDDVKVPDGEVGEKINKLFVEEAKDTSMLFPRETLHIYLYLTEC
jgi:translation initiation factor 5A